MPLAKALLTVAFATAISVAKAAAQTEIKFGHVGAPGSLFAQSAEMYAERANAKLGTKAKVVVYGSSQLGSDGELLKKLKLGTVDLALPSTVMTSVAPEFGVFEMPYLVQDRGHAARIASEVVRPILGPIADKAGYHIIGVWENGYREITNNKKPIVKPADLQGIKLRVPGGVWRVKMFKAYGANPSPMELKEVFVALQTGVMDGRKIRSRKSTRRSSRKCRNISRSPATSIPRPISPPARAGRGCRPTCRKSSPTPPRKWSPTSSNLPPNSTAN